MMTSSWSLNDLQVEVLQVTQKNISSFKLPYQLSNYLNI